MECIELSTLEVVQWGSEVCRVLVQIAQIYVTSLQLMYSPRVNLFTSSMRMMIIMGPTLKHWCKDEESWALKNWCFWTVVLEKTLERPLDCKEIQPVHSKGDQSWVFFGRTDAKAEIAILWPPHEKSWLIGKDPDAGKDWGQEEKGTTEDEMAGWHHWLDGHEFG